MKQWRISMNFLVGYKYTKVIILEDIHLGDSIQTQGLIQLGYGKIMFHSLQEMIRLVYP